MLTIEFECHPLFRACARSQPLLPTQDEIYNNDVSRARDAH